MGKTEATCDCEVLLQIPFTDIPAAAASSISTPSTKALSPPRSLRMASACGSAGRVGFSPAKVETLDVDMEVEEPPEKEAERRGLKRSRGAPNSSGSEGFIGVTTAEKKRTSRLHNNDIFLKKASNGDLLRQDVGGTSKIGGYLHGTHGSQISPDSNALRFHSSTPGQRSKMFRPTKICTFYAKGNCKKGQSCTYLHKREGSGSDNRWGKEEKAGVLAPVGYENHRGSEEGSQAEDLSNNKEPQFESSATSSKNDLYKTLIHAYGEENKGLTYPADRHKCTFLKISQERSHSIDDSWTMNPAPHINELVQNHESYFMGQHASYGLSTLTGFRNPGHSSSDHALGSPPFGFTSHLGMPSLHQLTPGIEKFSLCEDANFDKGHGTSKTALLVSSSNQPVTISAGHLPEIKDEPWITSVPFIPTYSFPDSTSPSKSQYDPLVDSIGPTKVKSINNLKSSNISCSISSHHTADETVIAGKGTGKSLNCNDKLARNTSTKGSNELAGLITPDRGFSSSLDGDNMRKVCERKSYAAVSDEKTREFHFHLAEHVKELLKPTWKEGSLSKDAHKLIVRRSVDKVIASLEPQQVPTTEVLIKDYITYSGTKIEKLVKAYVDKHCTR